LQQLFAAILSEVLPRPTTKIGMQRKITKINWLTWVRTWAAMDEKKENMTI